MKDLITSETSNVWVSVLLACVLATKGMFEENAPNVVERWETELKGISSARGITPTPSVYGGWVPMTASPHNTIAEALGVSRLDMKKLSNVDLTFLHVMMMEVIDFSCLGRHLRGYLEVISVGASTVLQQRGLLENAPLCAMEFRASNPDSVVVSS